MFNNDIKRTIGKTLKADGYMLAPPLGKGVVYYIKRHSEKLGFYVGCRDSRSLNGPITVYLHFTGLMNPDDSVMNFFSGLHVKILDVYDTEVTDEVMIAAGNKIKVIEKYIGSSYNFVLQELISPCIDSDKRPFGQLAIYREYILIYDTLKNDKNLQEEFVLLQNRCFENYKKMGESAERIERIALCSNFIDRLPKDYFIEKGIYECLNFTKDIENLKYGLSSYIYVQALFGEKRNRS